MKIKMVLVGLIVSFIMVMVAQFVDVVTTTSCGNYGLTASGDYIRYSRQHQIGCTVSHIIIADTNGDAILVIENGKIKS